jgi:hypothetical protein
MITGVVLFAFAMKTVVGHVGERLDFAAAFALCGGSVWVPNIRFAGKTGDSGRTVGIERTFASARMILSSARFERSTRIDALADRGQDWGGRARCGGN